MLADIVDHLSLYGGEISRNDDIAKLKIGYSIEDLLTGESEIFRVDLRDYVRSTEDADKIIGNPEKYRREYEYLTKWSCYSRGFKKAIPKSDLVIAAEIGRESSDKKILIGM